MLSFIVTSSVEIDNIKVEVIIFFFFSPLWHAMPQPFARHLNLTNVIFVDFFYFEPLKQQLHVLTINDRFPKIEDVKEGSKLNNFLIS